MGHLLPWQFPKLISFGSFAIIYIYETYKSICKQDKHHKNILKISFERKLGKLEENNLVNM